MSKFLLGQRVTVIHGDPSGLGTVHDVYGGPVDFSYRVLMDQRGEDGNRTMAMTYDDAIVPADPITPYTLGQRVTYFGRAGTITDLIPETDQEDPRDAVLEISCDEDPPECFSGVRHNYIFVVPAWKLHAYAR
jgi:hypothetical protein